MGMENPSRHERTWFRKAISVWARRGMRDFPWRDSRDPYEILLAEVLLQRTQARQVAASFNSIIQRYPTIKALHSASPHDIAEAIRPLGLSKRAVTIAQMAGALTFDFDGEVPSEPKLLSRLPGVGRYVASAVACFAFGTREAIVDANIIRVISRYFGWTSTKARPRDDDTVWSFVETLLPSRSVRDFNWALIDFAALVCKPRSPECPACPLRTRCKWATARANT